MYTALTSLNNSSFLFWACLAVGKCTLCWAANNRSNADWGADAWDDEGSDSEASSSHLRAKYLKSNMAKTDPAWEARGSVGVESMSTEMWVHVSALSCLPAADENWHRHCFTSLIMSANVLVRDGYRLDFIDTGSGAGAGYRYRCLSILLSILISIIWCKK